MLTKEDLKVGETYQSRGQVERKKTIIHIGETDVFLKAIYSDGTKEYAISIDRFMRENELIKPEPKIEILYECINALGYLALYFEDGSFPKFEEKSKSILPQISNLTRKTGRTFKLNMETWEIAE